MATHSKSQTPSTALATQVFHTKRKVDSTIERHKARWVIRQLDVHNAFLNGNLDETVYMKQPPGYIDASFPHHALVTHLLSKLSATFKIRDLGEPNFFLGIETIKCDDGILLSQQRYMNDILKRAGMAECKPLSTPISVSKIVPFSADLYDDPTQYMSLAGALQYLTVTRPDLSFAVNQLCQHMHAPTTSHWKQLKPVLRYVKGTIGFGLRIRKSMLKEIHAFYDSDWAGYPEDRKSTSGFAIFSGD
ncbi:PREDICTED: uncharacterized protein LOC109154715 [Ipomoea nil]|uniref:uncharacterized protein LOC109154715 n=1 Tax=Ipomoea nil TaxID=35883 RepID=UPI00090179BE|nr:PREDICTED: uncharacterized protein LOC109154715 [Ipomoea nil]